MGSILDLSAFTAIKLRRDDDVYDRVSHRLSVAFIAVCLLVVGGKHWHMEDKIRCFCETQIRPHLCNYIQEYCWVSEGAVIPPSKNTEHQLDFSNQPWSVSFHTWVPVYLLVQAFMFIVPAMLWRTLGNSTSYHVDAVVRLFGDQEAMRPANREDTLDHIARLTDKYLVLRSAVRGPGFLGYRKGGGRCWRPRFSLFSIYMAMKFLFLANSIGQLFFLALILDPSTAQTSGLPSDDLQDLKDPVKHELVPYPYWGFYVAAEFFTNGTYSENWVMFPREIICTFNHKTLGDNNHRYAIQCVLPLNAFNERVYLVMWYWLVGVAIVTCIGVLSWSRVYFGPTRVQYIKKTLKRANISLILLCRGKEAQEKRILFYFVEEYLQADGVFFLRLLAKNIGELEMMELVARLWDLYIDKNYPNMVRRPSAPPMKDFHNHHFTRLDIIDGRDIPETNC